MPRPIAFFITWTTYGTWLQGDDRGSILGRGGKQPRMIAPRRGLAQANHKGLKHEPVLFSESQRRIVEDTIRSHCEFKSWRLYAVAVRTNHVHVVVLG